MTKRFYAKPMMGNAQDDRQQNLLGSVRPRTRVESLAGWPTGWRNTAKRISAFNLADGKGAEKR